MVSYGDHHETSPSLGATFVGSREVQRTGVSNGHCRDLAAPWGAAKCASVATIVGSWEVQRSDESCKKFNPPAGPSFWPFVLSGPAYSRPVYRKGWVRPCFFSQV